jgi:hypothetical protein
MVNPEHEPLSGLVKADETIIPFRAIRLDRTGRKFSAREIFREGSDLTDRIRELAIVENLAKAWAQGAPVPATST